MITERPSYMVPNQNIWDAYDEEPQTTITRIPPFDDLIRLAVGDAAIVSFAGTESVKDLPDIPPPVDPFWTYGPI